MGPIPKRIISARCESKLSAGVYALTNDAEKEVTFTTSYKPPSTGGRRARDFVMVTGDLKGRYTRGNLLLKHAPEVRSWVSTPTSTHEGHDEGAE